MKINPPIVGVPSFCACLKAVNILIDCLNFNFLSNGIIISPHPRAKKSTIEATKIVLEAAVKAGAPEGIIRSEYSLRPERCRLPETANTARKTVSEGLHSNRRRLRSFIPSQGKR